MSGDREPFDWPAALREAGWPAAAIAAAAAQLDESPHRRDALHALVRSLAFVSDPSMGLRNTLRFIDACDDPERELQSLLENTEHRHLLCTFFAFSQFLSDIAIARPQHLEWILSRGRMRREKTPETYRELLLAFAEADGERLSFGDTLREFQRRELLRIGLRELQELADPLTLYRELSSLAEVLVAEVFHAVDAEFRQRHGPPLDETGREVGWCVYGMGKLGARELNFSSDVDIVFVYADEGRTRGTFDHSGKAIRQLSNHDYFCGMAEEVAKRIGFGDLYRVDTRLRPDGIDGPAARSLDAYISYFARQGRTFERVAYLRARCIAGDESLAREFDHCIRSFVYSHADIATVRSEVAALKRRIDLEALTPEGRALDIKRGTGGIREVEFIIAIEQLLRGPNDPRVQGTSTMGALDALVRCGYMPAPEAAHLRAAYLFFRRIEHTLQMMHEEQTHSLPHESDERARLALRCGYSDATAFEELLAGERAFVRERFLHYTETEEEPEAPTLADYLAMGHAPPAELVPALERAGVADAEGLRALRGLVQGSREFAPSARGQRNVERLLPRLLEELGGAVDPHAAIRNYDAFLRSTRSIPMTIAFCLEHPAILRLLVRALGFGGLLARQLVAHPEWFYAFIDPSSLEPERDPAAALENEWRRKPGEWSNLRRTRQREATLLQLRELLAIDGTDAASLATTAFAESIVRIVERNVRASAGNRRWFVLALGGFGSGDAHALSDLDLAFVTERPETETQDAQDAAAILRILADSTEDGQLWKADVRLRPEGSGGTLTVSRERFESYFARDAGVWEWLALLKARPVAGDLQWGSDVLAAVRAAWTQRRPPDDTLRRDLWAMRTRIERALKLPRQALLDLKRSPGGLWDIDFGIGYLLLRDGSPEALSATRQSSAIELLQSRGILSADHAELLAEHRLLLRAVQRALRLWKEAPIDAFPAREAERAALRRGLLAPLGPRIAGYDALEVRARRMREWTRATLGD